MWYSCLRLLVAGLFSQDPTSVSDSLERERKGAKWWEGDKAWCVPDPCLVSEGGVDFGEKTTFNAGCYILKFDCSPVPYCALSLFSVYPMLRRGFSRRVLRFSSLLKNGTLGIPVLLICESPTERSTPPSPPPLVTFLIWKWKLTETFEIQLLSGPVHFSSQLLKRQTMFMPYPLHHSNQWQSLFCSFCSLQVWNCFWLDIITNNRG